MQFLTLNEIASGYCEEKKEAYRLSYGGKGLNLAILIKDGFQVPDGVLIDTKTFKEVITQSLCIHPGLSPHEVIDQIQFSQSFINSLRDALSKIHATRWAVRSSSTDEDSQEHSFAGLQESIIGVQGLDDILSGIKKVWQSFYGRERLLYPIQASLTADVPCMAVIIQAYIEADVAGVVFTHHPFLGTHHLLVNLSRGKSSNVVNGKIEESISVAKDEIYHTFHTTSECLSKNRLFLISKTATQIEAYFNKPQDVEFAFSGQDLYILQTRAIIKKSDTDQLPRTLYSNVNVGEALSGPATPMTWSVGMKIAERGFKTLFDTLGLQAPSDYEFVTTFYGHIYLNVSQFLSVASQVPLIQPDVIIRVFGIPSLNEFGTVIHPISHSHFIKSLPVSMARMAKIQVRMTQLPNRAKRFCDERDQLMKCNLTQLSFPEIKKLFQRLNDLFFDCAFDMLSAGGSFLASYICFSDFIRHFSEDTDKVIETCLFTGLDGIQSAAPGFELLNISNDIRQFPELVQFFKEQDQFEDQDAFFQKIQTLPGGDLFHNRFDLFMQQYGNRANQEAELANPRWRENPRFLLQVIRAHLMAELTQRPQLITHHVSSHRQKRTSEFHQMISRSLRPFFNTLLNIAQKTARLREQWRAYVIDVLGLFRKFFLETAVQFVDLGIIHQTDDIFFLTYDEFISGLQNQRFLNDARLWIAFRKARYQAYWDAPHLPDTFVMPHIMQTTEIRASHRILKGIPGSPGQVDKAKVRVAHTLDEAAQLQFGEVLVASTTDVGWTPVFLLASAILTERGGPLSHAFVVAREYGIPAVVAIPNLMNTLKTGDIISINAEKGEVYL